MTDTTWVEVTPATIGKLRAEFTAELEVKRAEAHRVVDREFDALVAQQVLQWEMIRREVDGEVVQ